MLMEYALRYQLRPQRFNHLALRSTWVAAACVLLLGLGAAPKVAQAGQPRDWMAGAQPEGADMMLDLVFPGVQATLENRLNIYGIANQFTSRANILATAGFVESQLDLDLRVVVLTLGGSIGVRDTYRNHTFAPGESISISHRLDREFAGDVTNELWPYGELRAILSLPFNDHLVFNSINRFRFEGRPTSSYDWRTATVHDGEFFDSETMLLAKDRSWGAAGPIIQVMNYKLGGVSRTQVNWGILFTTRVGLLDRDDLIFVRALANIGGPGVDATSTYGLHFLTVPVSLTLAYRAVLPVWRPED